MKTIQPKNHQGGCHCGDVRYGVEVDVGQATRCNCDICTKLGVTGAIVKPAVFELLSGEEHLATYTRTPEIGTRYFCKRCHVFCFSRGHLEFLGGDFVSVNLNTLDGFDAGLAPVVYWDGRHDNWNAGPRPTTLPVNA